MSVIQNCSNCITGLKCQVVVIGVVSGSWLPATSSNTVAVDGTNDGHYK